MGDWQENATVNESTFDQEVTVGNSGSNLLVIENLVKVITLERCFIERIGRETGNFVDTVEDMIRNAILTGINTNKTPRIELANRSINASSGRDATSVMASSERGEHIGSTFTFENASERNITPQVFNGNDETRNNIPDEESELWVPRAHPDRKPHTHHSHTSVRAYEMKLRLRSRSELFSYFLINIFNCIYTTSSIKHNLTNVSVSSF